MRKAGYRQSVDMQHVHTNHLPPWCMTDNIIHNFGAWTCSTYSRAGEQKGDARPMLHFGKVMVKCIIVTIVCIVILHL